MASGSRYWKLAESIRSAVQRDKDLFSVLTFLDNSQAREQEFYWHRFYSFATIHAGMFVLFTALPLSLFRPWLAVFGVVLGAIWIWVQAVSRCYVNRAKGLYHFLRVDHFHIEYDGARVLWAPTRIGLIVPIVVSALWLCLLVVALWTCGK